MRANIKANKLFPLIILMVFIVIYNSVAYAKVALPNGRYSTTETDFVVQSKAGKIEVGRTWYKNNWSFIRKWNDLKLWSQPTYSSYTSYSGSSSSSSGSIGDVLYSPPICGTCVIPSLTQITPVNGFELNDETFSLRLKEETGELREKALTGDAIYSDRKIYNYTFANRDNNEKIILYGVAGDEAQVFQKIVSGYVFFQYLFNNDAIAKKIVWRNTKGEWREYDWRLRLTKIGKDNVLLNQFSYNDDYSTTKNEDGTPIKSYKKAKRTGVLDGQGNQVLWFKYDTDGNYKSIRDHEDINIARKVSYTHIRGHLFEVIDVLGNTWRYEYMVNGQVFNLANATTFELNDGIGYRGYLHKIIDPEGRTTTIMQEKGAAVSVVETDGTGVFYEYDYNKTRKEYFVRTKYSSGRVVEKWYSAFGRVMRRDENGVTTETNTYEGLTEKGINISGYKKLSKNELGHITKYEYDIKNQLIKTTYPDNAYIESSYDQATNKKLTDRNENGVITAYEYDANDQLVKMIEAKGLAEQRITTYAYDEFGNKIEEKRLADAVTEEAKTSYTYDDKGNRKTKSVSVTAAQSDTTNYDSYDNAGNLLQWRDGRGKVWKQTFDKKGRRNSITTPLQQVTKFDYDKSGNLTHVTNPLNKVEERVYDQSGRLTKSVDPYLAELKVIYNEKGQLYKIVDEEGKAQETQYDTIGRLIKQIDGLGNVTSMEYGVVTSQNIKQGDIAARNYPTFREEYTNDNRARLAQTVTKLANGINYISSRKYNVIGNVTQMTDAENKTTKYEYDALNRLKVITYPDLSTSEYSYDNRDNLLSVINENKVIIRTYTYDHLNRVTSEIWPTGKASYTYYDANGNRIQHIDNNGQVLKQKYDEANRLVENKYFATETTAVADKIVSFNYNAVDRLTGYDDGITSAVYVFDDVQRKTKETVNYPGFSKVIDFEYYKNGLKKNTVYPDAANESYFYDEANRLSQVLIAGEGAVVYNRYHWNAPEKVTYPGGVTRNLSYDALMRPTEIRNNDPANNVIMQYVYGYDKASNITSKNTEHGNYVYVYDQRYRLSGVSNPVVTSSPKSSNETFSYDDAGNRLSSTDTSGTWIYNSSNQLKSYAAITLDYDDNGNTIKKTEAGSSTHFIYNTQNRLAEVKDNASSSVATYYYDPFGRRLYKETGGQRTYFMYAEEGLIAEFDATGTVTQSYGYTPQSSYGTSPLYTKTSVGYAYYQLDHLGAPQQLINKNGSVVWKAKALSFGETFVEVATIKNNLRFPGQYYDEETGQHYNYFRDYEPETGRYVQSDPIGLGGGMNTYGYVLGNPIKLIDPIGLIEGYAGGGFSGSAHLVLAGISISVSRITTTSGKACTLTTICLRLGPGLFIGGGASLTGGVGASNCGSGISFGVGGDIGAGPTAGVSGSVSSCGAGVSGSPPGAPGAGAGASAGFDICSSKLSNCSCIQK